MLKVLLAFAVLLVAVYTQSPPIAVTPCVSYANSTDAAAFCASAVTYRISNSTDYTSTNNAARTNFDANLAVIVARTGVNATDACRAALLTYSCHQSFARCVPGSTTTFNRPQQATCNAVMTACNVTNFPATSANFTGEACTANAFASVEGLTYSCVPTTSVGLGSSCALNQFDANAQTPSNVVTPFCAITSACNFTASNPTCVRPNNIGDACVDTCVSNPLSTNDINGVGQPLTCIQGRCNYMGKRAGQTCFNSTECASNNCTNSVCRESDFGGPCTTALGCQENLYCDLRNNTCYQVALNNEPCGNLQTNWDAQPCKTGFTCVRNANGTALSRCRPNANEGEACVVATGIINDGPLCTPYSASGVPLTCQNNICLPQSLGGAAGASCNATAKCNPSLTCSYANSTTQGVCVAPNTVACYSGAGISYQNTCNDLQVCTCGSNLNQTGVCALDTTNPTVACATQLVALKRCQVESCRSAPFVAYEPNACVTTTCATQLNAFYCCVNTVKGTNFIAPQGFQVSACSTPTPTPGPTSPTTGTPTATGTPVPIQSSKRSSATTTTINLIVMIIAVIAFL